MTLEAEVHDALQCMGLLDGVLEQYKAATTTTPQRLPAACPTVSLCVDATLLLDAAPVVGHVALKEPSLLHQVAASATRTHLRRCGIPGAAADALQVHLHLHTLPYGTAHLGCPGTARLSAAAAHRYLLEAASLTLLYRGRPQLYSLPAQLVECAGILVGIGLQLPQGSTPPPHTPRHRTARLQNTAAASASASAAASSDTLGEILSLLGDTTTTTTTTTTVTATALLDLESPEDGSRCVVSFPLAALRAASLTPAAQGCFLGSRVTAVVRLPEGVPPEAEGGRRRHPHHHRPLLRGLWLHRAPAPAWGLRPHASPEEAAGEWEELRCIALGFAPWGHPSPLPRLCLLAALCSALLQEPLHAMLLPTSGSGARRAARLAAYCASHSPAASAATPTTRAQAVACLTQYITPPDLAPHGPTTGVAAGVIQAVSGGGGLLTFDNPASWQGAEQRSVVAELRKMSGGAARARQRDPPPPPCHAPAPPACVTVQPPGMKRPRQGMSGSSSALPNSPAEPRDSFLQEVHAEGLSPEWVSHCDLVCRDGGEGLEGLEDIIDAVNHGDAPFREAAEAGCVPALRCLMRGRLEAEPAVGLEAAAVLKGFYVAVRGCFRGSVHATPRLLSTLIRTAAAIAVLMRRSEATVAHAFAAVSLVAASLSAKTGCAVLHTDVFAEGPTLERLRQELAEFARQYGGPEGGGDALGFRGLPAGGFAEDAPFELQDACPDSGGVFGSEVPF